MANPIHRIPGLGGYVAAQEQGEREQAGELQRAGTLLQLQQAMQAQKDQQMIREMAAQSGGNLEEVIKGALKAGRTDIAAKLAPLVEAQRKAQPQPQRVVTPTAPIGYRFKEDQTLEPIPGGPAAKPPQTQTPQPKAPSGYRFKPDGSLEPIPGGPHSPTNVSTGFTKDALDLRARQYLSGDAKAFANLGRGAQGRETIVAITNRAAEMLREQGGTPQEIGRRIAEFRANSNSLNKMTQSYDAIVAFEQTAVRNGKILKEIANKVDTTGTPVVERWIRAGRKAVAGDPDVSAFQAQLQVYRTEAARILTNPNLSGQLTDSARREVEEFMKSDASAKQITAVVDLLERDFANRKQTLEQQMRDIRRRLEKNISAGEPEAPKNDGGPYSDAEKERRYQEWKARQKR